MMENQERISQSDSSVGILNSTMLDTSSPILHAVKQQCKELLQSPKIPNYSAVPGVPTDMDSASATPEITSTAVARSASEKCQSCDCCLWTELRTLKEGYLIKWLDILTKWSMNISLLLQMESFKCSLKPL